MKTIKIKATFVFEMEDHEEFDIHDVDLRWAFKENQMKEGAVVTIENLEGIDSAQKTDVYAVYLSNFEDVELKLVDKETFDFILEGGRAPDDAVKGCLAQRQSYGEILTEKQVRKELENFTGSTTDNDRAMAVVGSSFNGERFSAWDENIASLMAFCKKHNLELSEDMYNGALY